MMDENQNQEQLQEQPAEASPALEGIQQLQEEQPATPPIEEKPKQEQPQQNENMRALRLAKQQAEKERDEAMRLIREVAQQQQQKQQAPEEDLSIGINPDEYAEGKHLLKMSRRMEKIEREHEDRMRQYEQQAKALAAESQLRMQYPDIDKVINSENIALLRDEYPELAATINSNQDVYSKSVAAYTMIKRLGIHQDSHVAEAQNKLQQNSTKPRSAASVSPQRGENPLDNTVAYGNGLTKEAKAKALRDLEDILGY